MRLTGVSVVRAPVPGEPRPKGQPPKGPFAGEAGSGRLVKSLATVTGDPGGGLSAFVNILPAAQRRLQSTL